MQTLQLVATVQDDVIGQFKIAIENFVKQYKTEKPIIAKVEIIEPPTSFDNIKQLKGILNHYYDKPLTDEDIEEGINAGILDRAMI